jgi:LCP family protein required for cell wall assembly
MNRSYPHMAARKKPGMDRMTLILLVCFVVFAVITAILTFIIVRNLVSSTSSLNIPGAPVDTGGGGATAEPGKIPKLPAMQPDSGPTPDPWDGASRVTILLMGLDYRDWEAGEVPRSDTMILFSLDPVSRTASMLSIPRDLWVNIPGYNYAKINTAYFLGEINKYPNGGGPGLAMETVEQFLGVPINYYAQVDFKAFIQFVDEIDGVKITPPETITIEPMGPRRIETTLEAGKAYVLNGELALAYARARYSGGGDFDRARRTQQVILAIRDRVLKYDMIPKLILKAPQLYKEMSASVRTNMTFPQIVDVVNQARLIDVTKIHQGVIGEDMVEFSTSSDGQSILLPVYDKIRTLRDSLFASGGSVNPAASVIDNGNGSTTTVDIATLVRSEAARISVQNGTNTPGLASKSSEFFLNQGMNIVEETNAERIYEYSTLIIYNGKPYTASYLANLMGIKANRILNQYNPDASVDIVIVLGNDWANNNPLP